MAADAIAARSEDGGMAPDGERRSSRFADIAYPAGTVVLTLVLWEVCCRVFKIPTYLIPPPSDVLRMMARRTDMLLVHTLATTVEIVVGFLLSIVVGVILALLIASYKPVERAIYPLLVISQAIPKVAIAPLFIIWFGLGWQPKVLVAVLIAFFPIVVDLVAGIRSVPISMHKLALSMGASRYDTLMKFVVPHALPHFFSGLKVAITLAVSGAIIGEFVGADRGLGYLLLFANGQLDTNLLFASIAILSAIGIVLFYLLLSIERVCMPWHVSAHHHQGTGLAK
jgi:NitT/TauT family transport system permease protein